MRTFAEALYYGCIVPRERSIVKNPDYAILQQKIIDIKMHFQSILPPEEWERFEEMEVLQTQSTLIEEVDAFSYGLNMGILLMLGTLAFKDEHMEGVRE